ncbi:glycosyltransferase [Allisonella histaminiformans]|uniref:glycosyltransferase n=1 Tax=Allisonella histaminiformans TaxID=209880 RepID=UPI00307D0C6C
MYKAEYPDFKFVVHQKNLGLGLSLRDGVLACTNELIARMDTDDIAMPDRFDKQLRYLTEHPKVAMLGSLVEEFSESPDNPDILTKLPVSHAEIVNFAKRRNPFRHMRQ